ncbi:MAG: hypothetical protein GX220_08205 [Treponema sp.]|nr:hypothetical protein [Treponema sp.]
MAEEKHVNYFALQKACEKPGCPLCTLIEERITRYIDIILFEHISDRRFRADYKKSGGFCKEHSKVLLNFRDGLAVAILGRGTLSEYIEDFKKKKMRLYKGICPACLKKNSIEEGFLSFLAEKHNENMQSELESFFTKSEGLCLRHYAQMVKLIRRIPKWLETFQMEKFEQLYERVSNFIELSAWGRQEDFAKLSDEDKIVWKELAIKLQ